MKNFDVFIKDLKRDCKKHGVKLILRPEKHIIENGEKYGGMFDGEKKELQCAFPDSPLYKYKELLIHESCHMDQWIHQTKEWIICEREKSLDKIWSWMDGKKIKNLDRHLTNAKRMEAECERMSIEKIIKYKLPIDIKQYARKANSYLMLYSYLKRSRKWCDVPPYKKKEIYEQMPAYAIIHNLPMTTNLSECYDRLCYK